DLIASTRGKVWKKTIDHSELEQYQASHEVISTRLFAGKTIVHVLSDTQPQGFEPVEGGLEDVYFSTLSNLRRAA
ncbi:MAG TPA: ABC transporter ATP-binding protein, partial [Sphingomicrobium sp.]